MRRNPTPERIAWKYFKGKQFSFRFYRRYYCWTYAGPASSPPKTADDCLHLKSWIPVCVHARTVYVQVMRDINVRSSKLAFWETHPETTSCPTKLSVNSSKGGDRWITYGAVLPCRVVVIISTYVLPSNFSGETLNEEKGQCPMVHGADLKFRKGKLKQTSRLIATAVLFPLPIVMDV